MLVFHVCSLELFLQVVTKPNPSSFCFLDCYLVQGVLEREIEKLVAEPEAKIVVYCAGGVRSVLAAENLQKMGYQNVVSMTGGIAEWQRAGLPFDQTTK